MNYRISVFWKLDRISENHLLIVVWNRKFNLKHENEKVIHMLYFCYKKLLIREYVDFSWRWLDLIVEYLVKIGFLIPFWKWNKRASFQEIKMIDNILHNELWLFEPTTNDLEIDLLKRKATSREINSSKKEIIKSPFLDFLMSRESKRNFNSNYLDYNGLISILQSWLVVNKDREDLTFHWVTASAWCFYEIEAYFIVFKDIGNLTPWCYKYDKYNNTIIKIESDNNEDVFLPWIKNHFEWINAMLIFVWNIEFISQKYAHKSYLYQSIETGLIQQNITLYCMQKNIWTCILWWFNNSSIRSNLWLNDNELVYSTMLF